MIPFLFVFCWLLEKGVAGVLLFFGSWLRFTRKVSFLILAFYILVSARTLEVLYAGFGVLAFKSSNDTVYGRLLNGAVGFLLCV